MPSADGVKSIKAGKTIGNFNGNYGASSIVIFVTENDNGGERGIRTPRFCTPIKGNLTETPE
jgi:hypothetical protein